ncbi:MAG: hypothetical protein CL484_14785 [Acidobacteria bacterium]|nr:hypothetical protein [Acidobacteriota bacterium]
MGTLGNFIADEIIGDVREGGLLLTLVDFVEQLKVYECTPALVFFVQGMGTPFPCPTIATLFIGRHHGGTMVFPDTRPFSVHCFWFLLTHVARPLA